VANSRGLDGVASSRGLDGGVASSSSYSLGSSSGNNLSEAGDDSNERQGYFAVYDGHCGSQAAVHLQDTLHHSIFHHPLYNTDVEKAIVETCIESDKIFLEDIRAKNQYAGTTANGALIRGNQLVVFNIGIYIYIYKYIFTYMYVFIHVHVYIYNNIGDCHAVLCQNGVAIDMSDPHKPNRPDESARILEAKVSTYAICSYVYRLKYYIYIDVSVFHCI
jgi:protein phosphatase 1L